LPPSAASASGSSALGSACAIDPQTVPRLRTWKCETCGSAAREQRRLRSECRAPLERGLSDRRADFERTVHPHAPESRAARNVDQQARLCKPHVEHGNQRLTAGQNSRLLSVFGSSSTASSGVSTRT
jgi:hypothetical protein